jgi:tartrate dehydrogenase/decarboxylase/D-malate dehydrogenase
MREHTIAVIPGDGIGREVIPEGVRVLEAVGAKHGLRFKWQEFPWSCDWYKAHGKMCPDDAPDILRKFDAIYFGAVGNPSIVADHISAWGLLINFRRWFDLYVNLRPVRLFEGLPCPLAGRKPGDIDYMVIRENTEGEYGNVGGRMYEGTEREGGDAARELFAQGRRPDPEVRVRAGEDAQEACHFLHQVERHLDHHAVLG